MAWPLRRWFRLGWWIICSLTLLALPLIVWDFFKEGMPIKYQAWFVGGIFCLISIPISIYEVAMHIEYYTRPRLQRHVIRILWMVPIYAIDAWFALRFRSAREYLDPVRECYEAYVIWNFYAYLMAFLEDEQGDVELYLSRKPQMNHFPPFKYCIAPWTMGRKFLMETKKGVMNYVILRPLMTAIGLITDWFGKYGQGHIDFTKSYVYLVAVTNFSQLWALYCLAMMYSACHQELAPIRPLSKFLCIKAVVFLTFWQGVVLAVLVSSGWITDQSWSTYDQLGVASGIQDFLVCVEMFIAALAHAYAFPPKDYMGAGHTKGFVHNVKHMFDLRDVVQDMGDVVEDHVGTAAEAVTTTTQAVLTVPKQAVRTAAKGLKLFTSAEHGKKGEKGWSPRSSSEDGDEDERLEEGRMQHPTDLELEAAARLPLLPASSPGNSSVGRAIQPRPSATLRKPLLRDLTSSSTPTDSPTLHHRHVSDPAALGELGTRPTHVRRTSSRTSDIEEQMAIKLPEKQIERAGSKAGGMASWWGSSSTQKSGSGELNAVRGASAARTRPVRDEAQQPLLGSQPESPLVNDNPLKHHD